VEASRRLIALAMRGGANEGTTSSFFFPFSVTHQLLVCRGGERLGETGGRSMSGSSVIVGEVETVTPIGQANRDVDAGWVQLGLVGGGKLWARAELDVTDGTARANALSRKQGRNGRVCGPGAAECERRAVDRLGGVIGLGRGRPFCPARTLPAPRHPPAASRRAFGAISRRPARSLRAPRHLGADDTCPAPSRRVPPRGVHVPGGVPARFPQGEVTHWKRVSFLQKTAFWERSAMRPGWRRRAGALR
jgi:hypothetical protein